MHARTLAALLTTAWLACPAAMAQAPFHDRGPGELLPPLLREGPPAGAEMVDLTVPAFLWAFRRDSLRPPSAPMAWPADTVAKATAALLAATRDAHADVRWQSLWALARVARRDPALAAGLHTRILGDDLLHGDGPLDEVACVAAGLAAHDADKVLAALAKVATTPTEPERRRAFAFYGLGLAANASTAAATQFRVLAAVERALLVGSAAPPQVRIAALHALALTRRDVAPKLQAPALALLDRAWQEPSPPGPIDFAAHVPIAVAALLAPTDAAAPIWRERFAAGAAAMGPTLARPRSCTLALGALCPPWDAGPTGEAEGESLRRLAAGAPDQQVRNFAWIAMGEAGGAAHRAFLLQGLRGNFLVRGWAALGLAAMAAKAGTADAEVVAAVAAALDATKHPSVRADLAAVLPTIRREAVVDPVLDFRERFGQGLPGSGDTAARVASLLNTLADASAGAADRSLAALALGHLLDPGARHWSADLARAIDYRSATPVLIGLPNGVLRLP